MSTSNLVPDNIAVKHQALSGSIVYTAISLISIIIITVLLTLRLRQFLNVPVKALNVLRCVTISIYGTAICMIFTLALMYSGIGLVTTYATCRSSIIICFVWYGLNRAGLIFFFIERAHNIRSSELDRSKDWIWIIGALYTCVLCLTVFVLAMVYSNAEIIDNGTMCQLGLPTSWLIGLMVAGAVNYTGIITLYLWLLKPTIRTRVIVQDENPSSVASTTRQFVGLKSASDMDHESSALPTMITTEKPAVLRLEVLIKKSIYGALLMLPTEIFNFAYFVTMGGMERSWVCFLICTLDVLASTCVIHWLTVSAKDTQKQLRG